jgi:hypothetical protein
MGASWQTPDQKAFIEEHIPLYIQHSTNGTAKKAFWPDFLKKWFTSWPLPELSPELVEGEESTQAQEAIKLERGRKISVSTVCLPTNQLGLTIHTATEACFQSGVGGRCCRRPTKP